MNDNIIESIEWHKEQLSKLLNEDEFNKVEIEIDGVLEKFRLKGSKDKSPRKTKKKNIKDIISDAFGSKDKKSDAAEEPKDIDERLRNLKRAQKHHPRR